MSVKDRQKKMHRVQKLSHRVKAGRLSTPQNYQRMRKWQMHTGMQASRCKRQGSPSCALKVYVHDVG